MYTYKMLIIDATGNKIHFNTEEPNQYDAEMLAEEYATQGGVDVDSVTVIETDNPQGIIHTGNW